MSLSPYEEGLLRSLRIRQTSTVTSLAVLLYEYVIMARREFRFIWRRPFKLNQAIYLFSRYFSIITQSVNAYLTLGPHSRLFIKESTCRKWLLFQALTAYALSGALHLILMLMVYALHFKDLRVGIFLVLLYIYQIAMEAFITPKAFVRVGYNPICDTREVHYDTMIYLGVSTWATYISLVALTAVKRNLVKLGAPVVKRVIRDAFAAMLSYSWVRQVSQGHVVFGWSNIIVSIACCRIIMNMETLDYAEPECDLDVGFNSFDNRQLGRLEGERREHEGLETDGGRHSP